MQSDPAQVRCLAFHAQFRAVCGIFLRLESAQVCIDRCQIRIVNWSTDINNLVSVAATLSSLAIVTHLRESIGLGLPNIINQRRGNKLGSCKV